MAWSCRFGIPILHWELEKVAERTLSGHARWRRSAPWDYLECVPGTGFQVYGPKTLDIHSD